MPDVKLGQNAAGDYAIGVEVEGVFVPIASVSAARIGHLVERGNDLASKAEAGDERAKEVLEGDYKPLSARSAAKQGGEGSDTGKEG